MKPNILRYKILLTLIETKYTKIQNSINSVTEKYNKTKHNVMVFGGFHKLCDYYCAGKKMKALYCLLWERDNFILLLPFFLPAFGNAAENFS